MGDRWYRAKEGESLRMHKVHRLSCCDCSLVHVFKFTRKKDGTLWFRAYRDNRATANKRRNQRIKIPQRS
jgi:hypothetical protein